MKWRLWVHGALLALAVLLGITSAARAQRLIFERVDGLYSSGEDGSEPRKLLALGGKPGTTLWAVSHDGRRLAWLVQTGTGEQTDFASRPATVYITDLLTARHQKKLFSTADLRDRLGRKVGGMGASGDGADKWENGSPASLGWSADSRTLYVGGANKNLRAAFAVDAASGAALVDADGKWKSVAPLAHLDADGGLLVGLSHRPTRPFPQPAGEIPATDCGVIEVVNLVEGTRTLLWKWDPKDDTYPAPAFLAQGPALHPDHRRIAYASGTMDGGLFLIDRFPAAGSVPRRLLEGQVRRPRWSSDGKRILFLYLRPGSAPGSGPVYDLYDIPVADKMPAPRLLLQSVYWFDDLAE